METKGGNQAISREDLLKELQRIESHDAELLYGTADLYEIPLEIEKNEFFDKERNYEPDIARFAYLAQDTASHNQYIHSKAAPKRPSALRQIRGFVFISTVLVIVIFGAFFASNGFFAKDRGTEKSIMAYDNFRAAEQKLKDFNFLGAGEDFSKAYDNLISAEKSINEIGGLTVSIAENIPFNSKAESSILLLRAAKHTAKAGELVSSAFAISPLSEALSAESFLRLITSRNGETGYSESAFNIFKEKISLAASELSAAEQAMENIDSLDFPKEFRESIAQLKGKIPVLSGIIKTVKDYSEISVVLFGFDAPKRYLVLFQNSSELRPTGGFIGSYALIEMDKGALKNLFVDGIYNIDGQITINIIPPKPLQHIATTWSTHDANWFLDFPESAKKAAWFYEKAGGGKVDGVITLNVEVIERLLNLTGPVSLEGYEPVLYAENFRDEIQYEVEVAYDKKLNRPKQVLADFAPVFLTKLSEVSKTKNKEVISALLKALSEKYIMFYFKEEVVQDFFEDQGWSGSIKCQISNVKCSQGDYLAVVHSNIGGYKTDKFMEDEIKYDVKFEEDGSILGHLSVRRTHKGGRSKYWWYNRNNVDYIKIYVPEGSEILSYSGGERREVANPKDHKALGFMEDKDILDIESSLRKIGLIDVFSESGRTVFGTWLVTSPQKTSILEVSYRLPKKIEFKNRVGKYDLYLQKQPGSAVKVDTKINFPQNWSVVWAGASGNSLEQSFVLDVDKVIGYIFKN